MSNMFIDVPVELFELQMDEFIEKISNSNWRLRLIKDGEPVAVVVKAKEYYHMLSTYNSLQNFLELQEKNINLNLRLQVSTSALECLTAVSKEHGKSIEEFCSDVLEDKIEDLWLKSFHEESLSKNELEKTSEIGVLERILHGENPLKAWREYRGMTQQELADASRISRHWISLLEMSGKKSDDPAMYRKLEKLASALDCTVEDLKGKIED